MINHISFNHLVMNNLISRTMAMKKVRQVGKHACLISLFEVNSTIVGAKMQHDLKPCTNMY
jgi:hypothetical protein